MKLKKGFIHVYTGNGKGKTTAALGLALRALGSGLKVYIAQFAKKGNYGEIKALKSFPNAKVEQFGSGHFINNTPSKMDILLASKGLTKAREALTSKKYDIVILDEINIVLNLKLLRTRDVIDAISQASTNTEIILTGRQAPPQIMQIADLISDIREVRHYYHTHTKPRKGIEF